MMKEPTEGELFRRNYLKPSAPLPDSARARERLMAIFDTCQVRRADFASAVRQELGLNVQSEYHSFAWFWREAEIGDVLSAITLCYRLAPFAQVRDKYRLDVERILREEALRYRIGPRASIHPFVDDEFERNVLSVISGLQPAKHGNTIQPFEKALKELAGQNPSGKEIIRDVFEAVESLYLQMIPSGNRITEAGIKNDLTPRMIAAYPEWANVEDGVTRAVATFQAWVKSAHPFRHGTPLEEQHEAPVEYALLLLSQGAGFIRWLLKLDPSK